MVLACTPEVNLGLEIGLLRNQPRIAALGGSRLLVLPRKARNTDMPATSAPQLVSKLLTTQLMDITTKTPALDRSIA